MTPRYGIKIRNKTDQVAVEVEDRLLLRSRSGQRTPKLQSPTCANKMPAAIDAIHTPARSIRNRPWSIWRWRLPGCRPRMLRPPSTGFSRHGFLLSWRAGPEDFAAALAAALAPN